MPCGLCLFGEVRNEHILRLLLYKYDNNVFIGSVYPSCRLDMNRGCDLVLSQMERYYCFIFEEKKAKMLLFLYNCMFDYTNRRPSSE